MAGDSTINGLTPSGTLNGAEVFPDVQSGTTKKVSLTSIYNYIRAGLVTLTGAQTLEDKRITSRVYSGTYDASLAIESDLYDCAVQTALAGAISIDNPTGTPTDFQPLVYRIKDNGTSRAITWDTDFEATFVSLPTATTISKVLVVGFWWDSVKAKWCCINSIEEL